MARVQGQGPERKLAPACLFALLCCSLGSACATTPPSNTTRFPLVVMEFAPYRVPCTGVVETTCLRVRVAPDTTWRNFFGAVEGFVYEAGYTWRLEVERRPLANPPADGSSVVYRLLRVLSRLPYGKAARHV
jgi:hypothetical protein